MKRIFVVIVAALLAALAGFVFLRHPARQALPRSTQEFRRIPGAPATMDAGEYVIRRVKDGTLPGFTKEDHGSLIVPNIKPPQEQTEAYPVVRVIRLQKAGDDAEYYYIVSQSSAAGPWQLEKAWRASPNGQVLEQFPVPAER